MVMVKICGIRDDAAARACRAVGVDLAGLNFVEGSRRRITVEEAAKLLPELGDVQAVGLFRDASAVEVREVVARLGLGWIQLHGSEDVGEFEELSRAVKVLRGIGHGLPEAGRLDEWRELGAIPLIDGPVPGSGQSFDWAALEERGDFFIAGGLDPGNVADALRATGAIGVDVASGVEVDGRTEPDLIADFVRNARGAIR